MLLVSAGCQVILGDFTLDDVPSEAAAALGDDCTPNSYRCNENQLETCAADRRSWTPVAACSDADHCDPGAATCRTCTPGDFACSGQVLETCDATAHWQTQASCETPELCHVAADRKSGSCLSSPCGQADYTCSGNRLLRCAPTRDALVLVDRCDTSALCDASKASAQAPGVRGTCQPPACLTGTFTCDGATLERCNDDQTGWQPIATCGDPTSCNPLTGDCTPCSPGDVACSGAELWRCGDAGFAAAETCAAPELCDASQGGCDKPTCSVPGTVRCTTGDLVHLEECGNDLRWAVREVCVSRALCSESSERCLPPACEADAARCLGQEHQVCPDRSSWVTDQTCSPDQICTPAGCQMAPCTEGTVRCNDATLERCVSGVWAPQNRCGAAELCHADTMPPGCTPPCDGSRGDFSCSPSGAISQCSLGVSTELKTCDSGEFCDPDPAVGTGAPSCDVCQPLAYACLNGTELHRCLADGSAAPLVEHCTGGCSLAGAVPTCTQMP
jgi:hypothetical protein